MCVCVCVIYIYIYLSIYLASYLYIYIYIYTHTPIPPPRFVYRREAVRCQCKDRAAALGRAERRAKLECGRRGDGLAHEEELHLVQKKDQQLSLSLTHTHTDRKQHPRHRFTHIRQEQHPKPPNEHLHLERMNTATIRLFTEPLSPIP